jgi:hypothetical protein
MAEGGAEVDDDGAPEVVADEDFPTASPLPSESSSFLSERLEGVDAAVSELGTSSVIFTSVAEDGGRETEVV